MKFHSDKATPLSEDGVPLENMVFVFFCSATGKATGTSAKIATQFGFKKSSNKGLNGNTYPIITKESDGLTFKSEGGIRAQIEELRALTLTRSDLSFFIQKPGKSELGNEILAPMFAGLPDHVLAPACWSGWVNNLLGGPAVKRNCKSCSYREVRAKVTPASLTAIAQCAKLPDGHWLGENYVCDQFHGRD